jgi:arginyl-tRNA synthetase
LNLLVRWVEFHETHHSVTLVRMNVLALLRDRFAPALTSLGVAPADLPPLLGMLLPAQDAKFGDYQANFAMPLGKKLGKPPREIAQQLVAAADLADVCDPPEVAGPGFINLRLKNDWIISELNAASQDADYIGVAQASKPRTIVLDYSSPNVAKPMHVGHIRSTVIGDALYRILRFLGHHTISDNHLGDWGTQFGMIIYGYKHFLDEAALQAKPVDELSRLYRLVHALVEYRETKNDKIPALRFKIKEAEERVARLDAQAAPTDPKELKKAAKQLDQAKQQLAELQTEVTGLETKLEATEADPKLGPLLAPHANIAQDVLLETAALHGGDPTNVELWRKILPYGMSEIEVIYRRLGVTFDHTLGESFYHDRLRGVVKKLLDDGLARESEGAICVFVDGQPAPMIVQKKDGAYLYATTDLATIQYRTTQWKPDAILYVVDHRQSLHFDQLFAVAELWGYENVEFQHIAFGTVLGDDGRPFKTRSGTNVGLASLLDEAVERAHKIVSENDAARPEPLLSAADRRTVAERIGLGAIKYADLAHNRTSDYVFSYDKMLAMTGNTAAYMQYSYARVKSIFGKAGVEQSSIINHQSPILLGSAHERALALALLQFSEALDRVVADYRPNHLNAYLFELASRYSEFFENCPVLKAETDALRWSRLRLCDLTARTLQRGLNLLGIETVERM